MANPGGQFLSDEFGDIEDYFISDYWLIDQYIGDTLWMWGRGGAGELGINVGGDAIASRRGSPRTTFAGGTNWKQIVCSAGSHTVAVKTDGTLWTWGNNGEGQLGDNTTAATKSTPVTTFAGGTNWKQIACGRRYTASIKTDGTLWTWGDVGYGVLGILTETPANNRSTPVTTFAGGTNWRTVAGSRQFCRAIKTDGTLWIWGRNTAGQLGINNTSTSRITPVTTFAGGNNWKFLSLSSAGYSHSAAIKTNGTLWVWGDNTTGKLGTNDVTARSTPVTTFAGGSNWKSASTGYSHSFGIKTDGTLWGFGFQDYGRALGVNDEVSRSTPVTTLAGGTNWKQVFAGFHYTGAVRTGLNVDLS